MRETANDASLFPTFKKLFFQCCYRVFKTRAESSGETHDTDFYVLRGNVCKEF